MHRCMPSKETQLWFMRRTRQSATKTLITVITTGPLIDFIKPKRKKMQVFNDVDQIMIFLGRILCKTESTKQEHLMLLKLKKALVVSCELIRLMTHTVLTLCHASLMANAKCSLFIKWAYKLNIVKYG